VGHRLRSGSIWVALSADSMVRQELAGRLGDACSLGPSRLDFVLLEAVVSSPRCQEIQAVLQAAVDLFESRVCLLGRWRSHGKLGLASPPRRKVHRDVRL